MFIRYFLELPLPAEQVEAVLLGPAARWLEGLATDAGRRGEGLLAEVQVGPLGPHLARPVRIHLGDPARLASTPPLRVMLVDDHEVVRDGSIGRSTSTPTTTQLLPHAIGWRPAPSGSWCQPAP